VHHRFANREQAGRMLAERLASTAWPEVPVVLALPRGGLPVAEQVARRLHAPLDLVLVRKIGAPGQPELAVAAVVDGDRPQIVIDESTAAATGADRRYIDAEARRQLLEIERRREIYLRGRQPIAVAGRTVIVVDDGIATGTTVRAALQALRERGVARLVLAVPVAPHDTVESLRAQVDELVCLEEPFPFRAVGLHYDDFHQVEDEEVIAILDEAARQLHERTGKPSNSGSTPRSGDVARPG
jgi:putative phosphoribosyl transferase